MDRPIIYFQDSLSEYESVFMTEMKRKNNRGQRFEHRNDSKEFNYWILRNMAILGILRTKEHGYYILILNM